jgi:hypothetical protein
LRGRLWKELQEANETFRKTDGTGWNYDVTVLDEVEHTLKRVYGLDAFQALDDDNGDVVETKGLQGLVLAAASHAEILDVVEACWGELWPERRAIFQRDVNAAFEEEGCPWRLADGHFFKVDSEFLEQHVLANAHATLGSEGFKGALDEFLEARNDVASGDTKDAILKACKSMESVLKVMLGVPHGNASELLKGLQQSGAFSDLPEEGRSAMEKQVLMTLPALRNKLAGHGQGGDVVAVPKRYALLAVHLAAVFNTFLIEHHIQVTKPVAAPAKAPSATSETDDIPF